MGCGASKEKKKPEEKYDGNGTWPKFAGEAIHRPAKGEPVSEKYQMHAYQYATTSMAAGMLNPKSIIYPTKDAEDSDLKAAVQYAAHHGIALALRSGGHQYPYGFSSTRGENLQVDMKDYQDWNVEGHETTRPTVTMGVGMRLHDVIEKCNECKPKIFFPHGDCPHVCVGGHFQTGGIYNFARSFGMLHDVALSFDMVLADATQKTVMRPEAGKTDALNDDLWFSVLGGSPGNFGVLTRVRIAAFRDKDFPNSMAQMQVVPWGIEASTALLDIVAQFAEEDRSADFNVRVCGFGGAHLSGESYDDYIQAKIAKEDGTKHDIDHMQLAPRLVCIQAGWTGCSVAPDASDAVRNAAVAEGKQWLDDINDAINKFSFENVGSVMMHYGSFLAGKAFNKKMAISEAMERHGMPHVREFPLPYYKYDAPGDAVSLKATGFSEWATRKTDEVQQEGSGMHFCSLIQPWGGSKSVFKTGKYDNPPTSLGFRDSTINIGMYAFYETNKTVDGKQELWDQPKKDAHAWYKSMEAEATGPEMVPGKKAVIGSDIRFLFSPQTGNTNLDDTHKHIYDSEEVYQRLLKTKCAVDPKGVFSPNQYCVGFNDLPDARKVVLSYDGADVADMMEPDDQAQVTDRQMLGLMYKNKLIKGKMSQDCAEKPQS
jgi:FAD/FMN-containing dehydrogenase